MHGLASHALTSLLPLLAQGQRPGQAPPDDEVTAGWLGFSVFAGLIIAVAVLGFFLVRQLKRVDRAKAEGVFGDAPESDTEDAAGSASSAGRAIPESPEVSEHSRHAGDE